MKKYACFVLVLIGLALVLVACGGKSQEQVSEQLKKQVSDLDSYEVKAEMAMNTGQEEQKYHIDILYQAEDHYRIELKNAENEQESQKILKNDDGVFVITPGQQKSFKFQSDWPENSSQSYLYHSLVNDILKDSDATFEATDDYYVFYVKANYHSNKHLPQQEIYFDKKTLAPVLVNVLDNDAEVVVQVRFSDFVLNPEVDAKEFQVEENIAESAAMMSDEQTDEEFEVLYPLNTLGAELTDQEEVYFDDGKRILMVFSGEKNFTLVQEKRTVEQTYSELYDVKGELIHLGFAIGGVSDSSIEWTVNGVDYYLASDELTQEELIEVAMSVQGREIK